MSAGEGTSELAGPAVTGLDAAGPDAAGPDAAGPDAAGPDVAALGALAERIAHEAADLIRAGGTEGARQVVEATKSSPTDVVTAMDRAVEELLRERIHQARPDDAVLGEERGLVPGADRGTDPGADPGADPTTSAPARLTWVLDPIDGTVNYLYGLPAFAVSVAVVTGDPTTPGAWEPVAACVLQPVGGDIWTAGRGAGSWFRPGGAGPARRLRMPASPQLDVALVATGFGYRADRRRGQARVLAELIPQVRDIRRVGSAALDLCWLAQGRLDAYYERGVNVWDIAAAALVVTEAGGTVGGLRSAPAAPAMTVAAAEPLFSRLAGLLAGLEADSDPADPASDPSS